MNCPKIDEKFEAIIPQSLREELTRKEKLKHLPLYLEASPGRLLFYSRGYKEKGTITTSFDMCVLNDLDGLHLVGDVIDCVPGLAARAAYAKQAPGQTDQAQTLDPRAWRRSARDSQLEMETAGKVNLGN